jgi:precorrin-6B C5,15-methyltransferase / cobalt-precorrin-6B C5,C15-methyltransferase
VKKVIIYGGTTEGRQLAEHLAKAKIRCLVFVATDYGEEMMSVPDPYIRVHSGRLTSRQMSEYYDKEHPDAIVDATHPYAEAVKNNIRSSREGRWYYQEIPFFRVHRKEISERVMNARYFDSVEECVEALKKTDDKIFLTTGSKTLPLFAEDESLRERLTVRVLPSIESLEICKKCQIPGNRIIAMQGPFTVEMNEQMLKAADSDIIVLKESGTVGGEETRIAAAEKLDVDCYIISRPKEQIGAQSLQVIEAKLMELLAEDEEPEKPANNKVLKGIPYNLASKLKENVQSWPRSVRWEVTLIGIGMDSEVHLTKEAERALREANFLFGAPRMIDTVSGFDHTRMKFPYYTADTILAVMSNIERKTKVSFRVNPDPVTTLRAAILFSGDTGFYSGCTKIYNEFQKHNNIEVRILPGISSVSAMAAAFGVTWQDAALMSAHGMDDQHWIPKFLDLVCHHRKTICLTSGCDNIRMMGKLLQEEDGEYQIRIGYNLGNPDEKLYTFTLEECENFDREGLSTVLVENCRPKPNRVTPGWSDDDFIRDKVPMTKEEIRSLSICKMRLPSEGVVYDIGSGSGSVTAEIAALSPDLTVYSIEAKEDAAALTKKNIEYHHLHNVVLVEGEAPDVLKNLPTPTHVFIGGSGGHLREILAFLQNCHSEMRVVLNAVSLETLAEITHLMEENHIDAEVCQVSVSRSRHLGDYHLMHAQNPVFIVSFDLKGNE